MDGSRLETATLSALVSPNVFQEAQTKKKPPFGMVSVYSRVFLFPFNSETCLHRRLGKWLSRVGHYHDVGGSIPSSARV